MSCDFAKIVRASCGAQVLFYVEPDSGDCRLHQVVNMDGAQADLSIGFESGDEDKNEQLAFEALDRVSVAHADEIIAYMKATLGLENKHEQG